MPCWTRSRGWVMIVALASACHRPAQVRARASPPAHGSPTAPASGERSEESEDAVVDEVFARTNAERRAAGLPELKRNVNLMVAAQIQASQMANRNLMAHEIPGAPYPTLRSRLAAVSYPLQAAGENIAAGYDDGAQAVSGWMRSSGHRANILSNVYTELGASVARSRSGKPYYAQVFGRPR